MSQHSYPGASLTVFWDEAVCTHAAVCVKANRQVFQPGRRPWVLPDAAAADEVAAIVDRCPSGALSYRRASAPEPTPKHENETAMSNTPTNNSIRVAVNGPAILRGDIELVGADGTTERGEGYALCRCGQSSNKPFCDGTHRTCGFVDPGVVGQAKPKEPPAGQTHLRAKVLANGPVVLEGPFRMQDGSGATLYVGGGGSLCRCGQSANRPFCDGAHKSCGWQDPGMLGAQESS